MHRFGKVIYLALKFLHVTMRDILVSRVLLITLVELFLKSSLRLSDLLVNVFDDCIDILTLANLDQDASLKVKHWFLNNSVVEVDHVRRYLTLEIRVCIHNWFEFILTETIGINMVEGSVEELRFVAKEIFIAADDSLITKFDVEVLLMGMAKSYAILAILLLGFLSL